MIKNLFLLFALIAGFALTPAGRVRAQTFTVLHSFTVPDFGTNTDGARPSGKLVANSSGDTVYGTTSIGGSLGFGTVFKVNTDGTGFNNLHSFNYSDGTQPADGLILSGNTLYGTACYGGISGMGTVFALNANGTGFTNLHSFTATSGPLSTNSDGSRPRSTLILSGNTLYGTASEGGGSGWGTVFKVNTDGTGFTLLHSFTALSVSFPPANSDGAEPYDGVILSGNTLYGTARFGGTSGNGTVFKVNTDGAGFTTLHSFTAAEFDPVTNPASTNSDGVNPGGLILSGSTLYGTASRGGGMDSGTVFALQTNGAGFTTLHSFNYISDGRDAGVGLILGNTLYGTAGNGGSFGGGTVFALQTDGTGFTTLHSFNNYSDGGQPSDGLVLSGNTLYGTAHSYGSSGQGTVFSLSFRPTLTIIPSGANVVLTWPTNIAGFDYTGYTLLSTTNLSPTAVWTTNSPGPVVVAGQNTVTDPASGAQKFFRLKSP